jgi:DNA-binding NarL/FixJ family response regulator
MSQTRRTAATAGGTLGAPADETRRLGLLLVDDHAIVREGMRRVVGQREDMVVVGEASSGEDAIEMVARRRPDIVLMDARMPGMGGLQATQRLATEHPDVRVVVFTAHSEQELLWDALDSGAQGFVLKDSDSSTLLNAIRQVAAGEPYVDPRLAPDFLRQFSRPRQNNVLSAREREILQMLADGHSNREVSERLVVSVETVKTHVKHILAKLEAEHRTQAVAIGIRQSLIR